LASEEDSKSPVWHSLPADEVLERVNAPARGLSGEEAARRGEQQDLNRITPAEKRSAWRRFLAQFANALVAVLLGAMAVMAALGDWLDAAVVGAVVLVNAVIGFIQEGRSERALEQVRKAVAHKATVVRDGHAQSVDAEHVVVGDIVAVKSGDLVPADLRLIEAKGLAVQEAALTGESTTTAKKVDPVDERAGLGDRASMAYSGTVIARGQGKGVVVAIGDQTEIGRIGRLLAGAERIETPLAGQLKSFSRRLTATILVLAVAVFSTGVWLHDLSPSEMFQAAVGLAVAAIPEALPAILTITMAIGVTRMARRKAIVRRLPAVETLGSVDVICADKTGTLTSNQLTVQSATTCNGAYFVEGQGYDPSGDIRREDGGGDADEPLLEDLARAALLSSDASVRKVEGEWRIDGDLTDGALVVFASKAGLEPDEVRRRFKRIDAVPYEADRQYMASLNEIDGKRVISVKGAPERILELSDRIATVGNGESLDRGRWLSTVEELASGGQRVLAVARREATNADKLAPEDIESGGFTLLGLCGMIDPARPEAKPSIAKCRDAGIQVRMVTGDHAKTAQAIASSLGLEGKAIAGPELDRLDEDGFGRAAREHPIIARATPEHKIGLIDALRAEGRTIAMTGDGFNDAPALNRADVGVAMGKTGTDAAKEAAEIVLTDDNFASIVDAVEEGRTVYDNIRKAIIYILPTSFGEAGIIILAVLLAQDLPITALQILWVNLVTEVTLSISIAFDQPAPDIMQRPPRPRSTPLLSGFLVWRIALVTMLMTLGAYGLFLWRLGDGSIEEARTLVVNSFVMFEIAYLFNCRYLQASSVDWHVLSGNRIALLSIVAVLLLQAAFTYLGFMNALFGSAPIGMIDWALAALLGLALFAAIEVEKRIGRKWSSKYGVR
jgi:magnesium-transporting ATPase (P-type)